MVTGWFDLFKRPFQRSKNEFVSVDAQDAHDDHGGYAMFSKGSNQVQVSQMSPVKSPELGGRRTPDVFGPAQRYYHAHTRSYSSTGGNPRPSWDPEKTYAPPQRGYSRASSNYDDINPLGQHRI